MGKSCQLPQGQISFVNHIQPIILWISWLKAIIVDLIPCTNILSLFNLRLFCFRDILGKQSIIKSWVDRFKTSCLWNALKAREIDFLRVTVWEFDGTSRQQFPNLLTVSLLLDIRRNNMFMTFVRHFTIWSLVGKHGNNYIACYIL